MTTPIQIRSLVKGAYDIQELRIQTGLRLCANFRAKLGLDNNPAADTNGKPQLSDPEALEANEIIKKLKESHRTLSAGIAKNSRLPSKFKGDEIIGSLAELALVISYVNLETEERGQFNGIEKSLYSVPIWQKFLADQVGVGPATASICIAYLDPYKAERPSQFWAYAGLDVGPDNRARGKFKEHLVERTYTTRKGETGTKLSVTYNPWLQARLIGAVGPSFLKTGAKWKKAYDNYKHRITTTQVPNRILCKDAAEATALTKGSPGREPLPYSMLWTPLRIHRSAIRVMLKAFLLDLWMEWRKLEGLPTGQSYIEMVRGYSHNEPFPSSKSIEYK